MQYIIFSAVWIIYAVVAFIVSKPGESINPWVYTAIVCSTIWAATANCGVHE